MEVAQQIISCDKRMKTFYRKITVMPKLVIQKFKKEQ